MLDIKGLTKIFSPGTINEKTALDHVDLSLASGDFVTIIGSNGAGEIHADELYRGCSFGGRRNHYSGRAGYHPSAGA